MSAEHPFLRHGEEPLRPTAATIAVLIREDRVLLVQRANPPDPGLWGFPGGRIEPGETMEACAIRELLEETGIKAEAVRVLTAVDAFDHDDNGRLRHHFILVAVQCRWIEGEPLASDDALDARWVAFDDLKGAGLALSRDVAEVALQARQLG